MAEEAEGVRVARLAGGSRPSADETTMSSRISEGQTAEEASRRAREEVAALAEEKKVFGVVDDNATQPRNFGGHGPKRRKESFHFRSTASPCRMATGR